MSRKPAKVTIAEGERSARGQARLNLRIPRAALDALSSAAARLKMTRAAVVVAALESYLGRKSR